MKPNVYFATSLTLATLTLSPVANARQEQDNMLTLFNSSTYALTVDERCQVFDYAQLVTAEYIQSETEANLKTRYQGDAVDAERARVEALASEAWTGCLDRATYTDEWAPVAQTRLYADAMIAAPGNMTETVMSCSTSKEGYQIKRSDIDSIKALLDAKYATSTERAQYEALSTSFGQGMAVDCMQFGYANIMIGVSTYRDRMETDRKHAGGQDTSVGEFGPWTSFRYYAFKDTDEIAISAYRAQGPDAVNLVGVDLDAPGLLGNNGRLYVTRDGRWIATLDGTADALEVRADGMAPVAFTPVSQAAKEDLMGVSVFELSKSEADAVLAMSNDTELSFFHQPGGREDWVQSESIYNKPGHLPVGRLKDAIIWASVPVAGDL